MMNLPSRATGVLDVPGDVDAFLVDLVEGQRYFFEALLSTGREFPGEYIILRLMDPQNVEVRAEGDHVDVESGDNIGFAFAPRRSGTYQLNVSGDEFTQPVAYAVQVALLPADDFADVHRLAAPMQLGTPQRGIFEWPSDVDSFAIDLLRGQHVTFDVAGSPLDGSRALRFRARLFDSDDQQVPIVAVSVNSKLQLTFAAPESGRYVLDLRARSEHGEPGAVALGDYTVSARIVSADDDHSDLRNAATPITLDRATPVRLDLAGDIDWFRVDLFAGEHYSFELHQLSAATSARGFWLSLHNSNGEEAQSSFGTSLVFEPQNSGTYFLRAWMGEVVVPLNAGPVDYELSVSRVSVPDVGGRLWNAEPLTLGATVAGSFLGAGDDDVFRFDAVAGQHYRWEFIGNSNFDFDPSLSVQQDATTTTAGPDIAPIVYDFYGAAQAINYQAQVTGPAYLLLSLPSYPTLGASDVYVYRFSLNTIGPDDHGDTRATATPLAPNTVLTARVATGENDVFRVELVGGQRYIFNADQIPSARMSDSAPDLRLFSATGEFAVASANLSHALAFIAPADGSYYFVPSQPAATLAVSYTRAALDDHGDLGVSATPLMPATSFDAQGLTLAGTEVADRLYGSHRADRLAGGAGDDHLWGAKGNDALDGGPGIDSAHFGGLRSAYEWRVTASGWSVQAKTGANGIDTLTEVERLIFDGEFLRVALDISGNAGDVAKIIGAVFGKAALSNSNLVGIGLKFRDAGTAYADLVAMAVGSDLFVQAVGSRGNGDFVRSVYMNVVGSAPDANALAYYAGLLDSGAFTQTSLALLACETDLNKINVDLIGLAATGLLYQPMS